MRLRVALAGGICAVALLLAPGSAHACSCAAIAPQSKFDLSDGAVIARLISVVPPQPYSVDYRYRILETFKAKRRLRPGRDLVIRAARDGATCGLPRGLGRRYGLFLRRSGGRWQAGLCDVTSPRAMREAATSGKTTRRSVGCGAS